VSQKCSVCSDVQHAVCMFLCAPLLASICLYLLHGVESLRSLTGPQPVKKFPAVYGTRRFITVFTSARHLSLSWVISIQTMPPYSTSWKSAFPYEYSENKSHLVGPSRSMPGSLPSSVLLPLIHWEGALQRFALQRSKSHGRLLDDNVITRGPMEVRW